MKLRKTDIPDCYEVEFVLHQDLRGRFVKSFQATAFRELGLEGNFTESFYSVSKENVIRGMHFQLAPADGAKLIYCLQGGILDIALDLRVGSPAYGRHATIPLEEGKATAAYLPRGVAHGFLVTKAPATVLYHVSSEYAPNLDTGVRWDSFGYDWPVENPLISARDAALPLLDNFKSPFRYKPFEVQT